MKIRSGFVSNSSSSSFIVINSIVCYDEDKLKREFKNVFSEYVEDDTFEYKPLNTFEWEFDVRDTVEEKFDWVCFFAEIYGKKDILLEFLQNHLDSNINTISLDMSECDVDHESVDEDNARMLESMTALEDFMFSTMSKIFTGNDNDYKCWSGCKDYENMMPYLEDRC